MYTNTDHRFDRENLHGPLCPRHGTASCSCCHECGGADDEHDELCSQADRDHECRSVTTADGHGTYCGICGETLG